MRHVFIALFVLLLPLAAVAQDGSSAQVDELLNGHHYVPSADDWQKLGSDGEARLIEVANDTSVRATVRGRAIAALAHFQTDSAKSAVSELLAAEATSVHLKRKAVYTLAVIDKSETTLTAIAPYLKHEDSNLREASIKAVASVGGPTAAMLLRDGTIDESSDHMRTLIQTSIVEAMDNQTP